MSIRKLIGPALVAAAALVLTGCREYKVEVRIDPNGGGQRIATVDAAPDLAPAARALVGLAAGWDEKAIEKDGKAGRQFTRRQTVAPGGWSRLAPDIVALSDAAGRARLDDRISVDCTREKGGGRCTYREVIAWHNLRETLADVYAASLDTVLSDSIPALGAATRAEIRGLTRGAVLFAWDDLVESDGHEHGTERTTTALSEAAAQLVAREVPAGHGAEAATAERVARLVRSALLDGHGQLSSDPLAAVPGIELSTDASLELRVTLPGPIVESNADEVQGQTAIWRVDLSKALQEEITLQAVAEMGR